MAVLRSYLDSRLVAVAVTIALILSLVLHQISFLVSFTPQSCSLSQTTDVIRACPRSTTTTTTPDKTHLAVSPTAPTAPTTNSTIPNIVHQIWKNTNLATYSVTASHENWRSMFEPQNYTVKLWTEDDVVSLLRYSYPWLLSTYQSYPHNIQRADIARLVVVHAEGGIYADLDVYPISHEIVSCVQHAGPPNIFVADHGTAGLSNHFFMAEKNSDFILWTLAEAMRRSQSSNRILIPYLRVFWSTGPMMVNEAARTFAWKNGPEVSRQNLGLLEDGFGRWVVHHAAGRSWHGPDGQLLNYIGDHGEAVKLWLLILGGVIILILIRRYRRRMLCVAVFSLSSPHPKKGCLG